MASQYAGQDIVGSSCSRTAALGEGPTLSAPGDDPGVTIHTRPEVDPACGAVGLPASHPVPARILHANRGVSGVNYFFYLTTILSPYRVASFKDVTELLIVVGERRQRQLPFDS